MALRENGLCPPQLLLARVNRVRTEIHASADWFVITVGFAFISTHARAQISLTKAVTCKHIHAVHMTNVEPEQSENNDGTAHESNVDFYKALLCQDEPEKSHQIERITSAIFNKTSDIIELTKQTNNVSTLQAILQHLQEAYYKL